MSHNIFAGSSALVYQEPNWAKRILFAAILLGLVGVYLGSAWWIGGNRQIFLLNGLDRPYAVVVRGQEITLPPGLPMALRVPEGDVEVTPADKALPIEPVSCKVETDYFTRPFTSPVFVVNPDRLALLELEETVYSALPKPNKPPQRLIGQPTYRFDGVDYLFAEFPDPIQVKGNQDVTKTRLGVVAGMMPEERLGRLMALNAADQNANLQRLATLMPEEGTYVGAAATLLKADEALALVQPKLAQRPLLVEWHRVHQNLTEQSRPDRNLIAEYDELAKATNESPDALYLRARLEDGAAATAMMTKAATAASPSPHARAALGFEALAAGRFEEAESWLKQALDLKPRNRQFREMRRQALLALRRFDDLLKEDAAPPGASLRQRLLSDLRHAADLAAKGDRAAANQRKDQFVASLPAADRAAAPMLAASFDEFIAVGAGDEAAFLKVAADKPDMLGFHHLLLHGKLAEAAALAKTEKPSNDRHLRSGLVHLFALRAKNDKLAADQLVRLIEELRKNGRRERRVAAMLEGKEPMDAAALGAMPLPIEEKRVLLRIAAAKSPHAAPQLLALAKKLTIGGDADCLCLKKLDAK